MSFHRLAVSDLQRDHQQRLKWFEEHAGRVVPFPAPIDHGSFLATRAKGIYKPSGWKHALSVRVMLSSPYADKAVEHGTDGGWSLQYYQEGADPAEVTGEYTNLAMLRCHKDDVPVGVLLQASAKPVAYKVLGLAKVGGWADGFFSLEAAAIV